MRKSTFIKHLESLEEEELRKELMVVYERFKEVKAYYSMELGGEKDREAIFEKAKKDIKSKYATRTFRRPRRPRVSKINKILSDLEKVSIFKVEMADLHLYNCECALEFILAYHYHSDPLHNTIVRSFRKGCQLIAASSSQSDFLERCNEIIDRSFEVYEYLGYRVQKEYLDIIDTAK